MSTIQEFSYSNTKQRKHIYFSSFFSAAILAIITVELVLEGAWYLPYFPVTGTLFLFIIAGLFLGNLAGRLIFSLTSLWRAVIITSELLFSLLAGFFFLKGIITPAESRPLLQVFHAWPGYIPLFLVILSFLCGIKTNYLMKISCGIFIDEKEALSGYFLSALAGSLLGGGIAFSATLPFAASSKTVIDGALIILPLSLMVLSAFLRLEYNPKPMYAQHFEAEKTDSEAPAQHRDDLFFTYLNFSYMIIYFFLGYTAAIKFYGDLWFVKLLFIAVTLVFISIGFSWGRLIRNVFWFIYSEIVFPVFFLSFLFLITGFHHHFPFYIGLLLFAVPATVFGFTLSQTVRNTLAKFDHTGRFKILDFSFIILPFPILIALTFIHFTYRWYFILLYIITLMNIVIPGIYLINRKAEGYKKISYFVFSLLFLPLLIITHVSFEIPLDNHLYVKKIQNFKELKSTNYNALFIKNSTDVTFNGEKIFTLKDSTIRNMKRGLATVYLHHSIEKPALFIDGNQKFFKNPLIGSFPNALCIDTLSKKNVDFEKLPMAGKSLYVPDEEYLLFFLQKNEKEFFTVIDIPNIYDQKYFTYRYTEDYISRVKKMHHPRGLYIHIFQLSTIDARLFKNVIEALEDQYRHHSAYLFSEILVLLNSDEEKSLQITPQQVNLFKGRILESKKYHHLFLDETHLFSHMIGTDLKELMPENKNKKKQKYSRLFRDFVPGKIPKICYEKALNENSSITSRLDRDTGSFYFNRNLTLLLQRRGTILSLLKKTELAEAEERFVDETKHLFQLKRYTEYNHELRKYLKQILSYKEEYYYNAALKLEREKNWNEAKTLYRAILIINPNNFDANYRLGLLSLTLQDLNESFVYLQKALRLNRKHPKTLYQMGVLMFSSGRTEEAIRYLNQAIEERENSPEVFLYLGLANEKLGKLPLALSYYEKAQVKDPNDLTIQSRIEMIKKKLETEKNRWKITSPKNELEEEQDEEIPLPINKSAYDIRLGDSPEKGKKGRK